jgi:hypothetical protein
VGIGRVLAASELSVNVIARWRQRLRVKGILRSVIGKRKIVEWWPPRRLFADSGRLGMTLRPDLVNVYAIVSPEAGQTGVNAPQNEQFSISAAPVTGALGDV